MDEFLAQYSRYEERTISGDIDIVRGLIGKRYDLDGIKGFVFPWIQHNIDEIFCTEAAALGSSKKSVRDNAHLVGVGELYRWSDPVD